MPKELRECMRVMSYQIENISEEIEIVKKKLLKSKWKFYNN